MPIVQLVLAHLLPQFSECAEKTIKFGFLQIITIESSKLQQKFAVSDCYLKEFCLNKESIENLQCGRSTYEEENFR